MQPGDNTGPHSARLVLDDPTVEAAVLETARGGLLRAGLGFDQCTVGVVLNVTADRLGLEDIHSPEEMARVKSVVAETVTPGGHAVLDADDALAHNPAAYEALSAFTRTWSAGERIGVIGIAGDRLDADMRAVGAIATGMFDRIIIKEDHDRRGRAPGETAALVHEGLRRHAPDFPAEIILDEAAALAAALAQATPGSLVVFLPEHVDRALHLLAQHGMAAIPEDGPE